MAKDNKINLPGGFGGLMRYSEEYKSYFTLKPSNVVMLIIFFIGLRILLPYIF
jgi:preprotein translocase subunit Sec61beta